MRRNGEREGDEARVLLDGLRALVRTQQISERADTACCGMTVAQAATIQVLYLEGPMRLGGLSKRLGISPSTLTRNVDRAEAGGLVERAPDPGDGRAWILQLTRSGRQRARELEDQNLRAMTQLLDTLPTTARRRVVQGVLELLEAIDRTVGSQCPAQFEPVRRFVEARKPAKEG